MTPLPFLALHHAPPDLEFRARASRPVWRMRLPARWIATFGRPVGPPPSYMYHGSREDRRSGFVMGVEEADLLFMRTLKESQRRERADAFVANGLTMFVRRMPSTEGGIAVKVFGRRSYLTLIILDEVTPRARLRQETRRWFETLRESLE